MPSIIFSWDKINNFSTILLSIVLEGLPFIIIGALISSFIQVFISDETVKKLMPNNKFLGMLSMALIGLVFPICECGIIPIARRLIKKGVPTGMTITFMLAVPIVNPVVLLSTYYAFIGKPIIVLARAIFGIIGALVIGYLIGELHNKFPLKNEWEFLEKGYIHDSNCGCNHCEQSPIYGRDNSLLREIFTHTSSELYDIGRFFIIGAILSSIMQTFIPRNYIISIGQGKLSSILTMMCIAFLLSICSETDAFIARTFLGQFTQGSILAFLIFGPMIDLKNVLMLLGGFNFKFVVKLVFLIFSICFIIAVIANYIPIFIL